MADHAKRCIVCGAASHFGSEAADGFKIMGNHVGALVNDHIEQIEASVEVRDKRFNRHPRTLAAYDPYHYRPMCGTIVGKIVAVHRGYDGMPQPEILDRVHYAVNFVGVERRRTPRSDVTEPTASCTRVTGNHERCRSVAPTFATIGT